MTIAGHPGDELAPGTLNSILKQAGLKSKYGGCVMQYLAVIEEAHNNYSEFLPDVPGCVATGKTLEEVKQALEEALLMHFKGLREDGLEIPQPKASADYIEGPSTEKRSA